MVTNETHKSLQSDFLDLIRKVPKKPIVMTNVKKLKKYWEPKTNFD